MNGMCLYGRPARGVLFFLTVTLFVIFTFFSFAAFAEESGPDPELKKEIEIGRRALANMEEKWPVTADPAATARLTMILSRLKPHMQRDIPYEVRVVRTDDANAFCLPGGFIFFTTGILSLLKTDAEIAAVMAHEMVHADRKHGLRMAAKANKVTLAALAVMLLSGGATAPIVLAQVAQVAITNSYTMELEEEADSVGLDVLIEAGYPPSGMITLMERFLGEEFKRPIVEYGIYMNHPSSKARIASALKKMKSLNLPVERKRPLGLLRTNIVEGDGTIALTVDGAPVWSGKATPDTRGVVASAREAIDKYLQMETAPYDVHIAGDGLFVGNRLIARQTDGMESIGGFRQSILKSMDAARRKHPAAKYFQ